MSHTRFMCLISVWPHDCHPLALFALSPVPHTHTHSGWSASECLWSSSVVVASLDGSIDWRQAYALLVWFRCCWLCGSASACQYVRRSLAKRPIRLDLALEIEYRLVFCGGQREVRLPAPNRAEQTGPASYSSHKCAAPTIASAYRGLPGQFVHQKWSSAEWPFVFVFVQQCDGGRM